MDITKLTDAFSVTAQISEDDIAHIAKLGFKTIFCHRPDQEGGETQPESSALLKIAQTHNIAFIYLPFSPGQLTATQVSQFSSDFKTQQKPILGFCKTGNRASTIYAAANVES